MSTPLRQTGEDSQTQMLRYISKQLDRLIKITAQLTVTTTTTATP